MIHGEFACHKTTSTDDDETDEEGFEETIVTEDSQHCAGALIMLEKMGQPHQMMRIAERLRMYDPSRLKMDAPVFDDVDEMEEALEMQDSENRSS